jgi:tol-pal system protein YbgF
MFRLVAIGLTAVALLLSAHATTWAQQAPVEDLFAPAPAQDATTVQKQPKIVTKLKSAMPAQKTATSEPAGSDTDQRIGQLEAQIADMQVVVGTMESMARGRGAIPALSAGSAPAASGDLDMRVGRLENQLQALSGQLADLSNQMRLMSARQGGGATGVKPPGQLAPAAQQGALVPLTPSQVQPKASALTAALAEQPANADTGFGQTTVIPGNGDGQNLVPDGQVADLGAAPATAPANPQDSYDVAYGRVLQQDYAGAETAFRDYLTRFPTAPLASNAHYWLGQSYYARGQYKPAADAFLKGYKAFRTGPKAPDSLLKVAMSLSRLGQKDPACSAFTALDTEFPNASAQIKHLAQSERDRTGC